MDKGGWQSASSGRNRGRQQQQQAAEVAPAAPSAMPEEPAVSLGEVQVPVQAEEVGEEEHPLMNTWTFHYYTPAPATGKLGKDSWQSLVHPLKTVASAEQFWGVFQSLPPPTGIKVGSDYHLFKEGVTPSWEDPANKDGGIWVLELKNQDRHGIDFDQAWMHIALALVGNTFTDGAEITGVTCGIRANRFRLRLWTRNANDEALQTRIGTEFKGFADIPNGVRVYYEAHADSMKSSSRSKPKYDL